MYFSPTRVSRKPVRITISLFATCLVLGMLSPVTSCFGQQPWSLLAQQDVLKHQASQKVRFQHARPYYAISMIPGKQSLIGSTPGIARRISTQADTLPTEPKAAASVQFITQPERTVPLVAKPVSGAYAEARAEANLGSSSVPASEIDNSPLPAAINTEREIAVTSPRSALPMISIRAQNVIASYALELPYNKTVSIIFPVPIKSVDLGSRQIIADKASDVENVLKVKAAQIGFNETNFSVITTDGKFYSFIAGYNEYPAVLALNLAARISDTFPTGGSIGYQSESDATIQFSGIRASQTEILANCEKVIGKGRTLRHLGVTANRMDASIRGFYVKENVMYVKIKLANKSNIDYDLDYMRFFIVDKTKAKKTTLQELELIPFCVYPESRRTIVGNTSEETVLAFPKFTIPDDKHIVVQMNELGGGRALSFVIKNEDIMHSGKL
jgi:conjugative transposon TraN protein